MRLKKVHFTLMKSKGPQEEIIIASIKQQRILNFIKQVLRIVCVDGVSTNNGGRF
jgi:hypothetical protein